MIGISALFLLSLASSVLGGDYHTTVSETGAPVSVSHADSTAAGTTDHAALTSVHSDVHADVHAVTTGSATVGSVQAAPSVAAFHGDSTMAAVHGYPGVTSFHDAAAPHTLYAAPVVNAVHTSVSGIPAGVSAVHDSSAAVTNVHAAPAVATPAVGTLHTSVEGASAVGTVHASPSATTTVPGAPAVTMVHSSPAGVSKVDTTSAYPAPTVTAYQDGSPYPGYYNPQFAYSPYYQPFPFVNGGAASASKMTFQTPYGQSAYQPAPVDSGYYQPSPYFGYVPGFGRPSAYPTAPVFPAYPASPAAANAYQAGSAMTPAQNAQSVTKATMVGSYPSTHVVSTMFNDAAPSVAGDHHAMPAVATTSTNYQTNPGIATVHSTQGIATVHSTPATGTTSATYQTTPEVGSVHTGPAVATTYQAANHASEVGSVHTGPAVATSYQAADHAFSNVHQIPAVSSFPAFPFYQAVPVADQMTKVDSYQTAPATGAVHSSASAVTSVHESAPAAATLHSATPAVGVHDATPAVATFHSATPDVTTVHDTGSAGPNLHAASPAVATTTSAVHEAAPALTSVHAAPVASTSPAGVTSVGAHHVAPAVTAVHGADSGLNVPTAVHAAPAVAATYGADQTVTGIPGYPFAAGYGVGPAFDYAPAYGYGVQDLGYGVAPFGAELSHAFPHYGLNYAYGLGPINYNALYLRRKKKCRDNCNENDFNNPAVRRDCVYGHVSMEQSDGCNPVLTTVTLCLFYHWMVIGVIMGFVFTLALEPEKIGNLRRTEHFNGFLWGISVLGLSIQAVNVAATLKVFRAVHHNMPRSMSSGAVLLATSNAMEAIFGLAFVFLPPFLPKSTKIPRLIWLAKLLISTPLAINVLYYANSKTEEIRAEEKARRRAAATDFPLVYVHPDDAEKEARVLVPLPVQTARTPALESTLLESTRSSLDNTAVSDGPDENADPHGQANTAPESKAVEQEKEKKLRGKTTLTAA